jgi:chromatin assembly factor 1 subunit A
LIVEYIQYIEDHNTENTNMAEVEIPQQQQQQQLTPGEEIKSLGAVEQAHEGDTTSSPQRKKIRLATPTKTDSFTSPAKSARAPSTPSSPLTPLSKMGSMLEAGDAMSWTRSPSKSAASSVNGTNASANGTAPAADGSTQALSVPGAKKRKLTPAEREARDREAAERKEAKERELAEKKAQREEEKRKRELERLARENEKRIKDEEKRKLAELKAKEVEEKRKELEEKKKEAEEKRKAKEEERLKKEEEKSKKEAEKQKKEASQLRLASFFVKPKVAAVAPTAAAAAMTVGTGEETQTIEAATTVVALHTSPKKPKAELSDYERMFQPFEIRPNVQLAPANRFARDSEAKTVVKRKLDGFINDAVKSSEFVPSRDFTELCHTLKRPRLSAPQRPLRELLVAAQRSEDAMDLAEYSISRTDALEAFKQIPIKHLHFAEDVRPPYTGTFTKTPSGMGLRSGRNPFEKSMPGFLYEYDSEAEWEEPDEDGEELNSEGEEEAGDEDDEDMDEFLDDEETVAISRIPGGANDIGDPVCSGICWEDAKGVNLGSERREGSWMERYRVELISRMCSDPFVSCALFSTT